KWSDILMKQMTVVGSGVMGKGIAYAFATKGFKVYLNDLNDDILSEAKKNIDDLLKNSFEKGFLKEEAYQAAKENLIYEASLEAAAKESDLVIEAVLEKIELKIDIFKKLDTICKAD